MDFDFFIGSSTVQNQRACFLNRYAPMPTAIMPPAQVHGNASVTSAKEYQAGPNPGPRAQAVSNYLEARRLVPRATRVGRVVATAPRLVARTTHFAAKPWTARPTGRSVGTCSLHFE